MKKIRGTTQSGRSKTTLIITLALFVCALFAISIWLLKNDQAPLMGELVYRVDTPKDVVTLIFDDGTDTPEAVYQRTMGQAQPGSIVLLHAMYGDESTLAALPKIIDSLKRQGGQFKTVTEPRELGQNVQLSRSLAQKN